MKSNTKTTTIVKKPKITVVDNPARFLSLDDIEQKMVELATVDTNDLVIMMANEKKLAMLEKVANLKIHRLQLKELERQIITTDVKPIEVKFISSKNSEQQARIERIDNEILEKKINKQDA